MSGSVVSRIDRNGSLDLSGQNLTAIPDELRAVAGRIVRLNVEDNQINELPDWLCEMTKLKVLCVRNNRLTRLPRSLCTLSDSHIMLMLYGNPLETPKASDVADDNWCFIVDAYVAASFAYEDVAAEWTAYTKEVLNVLEKSAAPEPVLQSAPVCAIPPAMVVDTESPPLIIAAASGDINTVTALLGKAPVSRDANGATALHHAAGGGHVSIVELIAQSCVDATSARDYNGMTALHWAAAGGHVDCVGLLCATFHADPAMLDFHSRTAADVADAGGHDSLAATLTPELETRLVAPSTMSTPMRSNTAKASIYKEWECSVCRNSFDRLERLPRSLACSHVFCTTCLVANSPRVCPVCKAGYDEVDALTVAYGLITLAESKTKATVNPAPPACCNECYKGRNVAVAHCITCETELCEMHADRHAEERHAIEVLRGTRKIPAKLVLCPLLGHGEPLKLYCRDCGVPLCHLCASMHHMGHRLIELHIVEGSLVPELEQTVMRVWELADRSVSAAAHVAGVSQQVEENQGRVAATIQAAMQQLRDAVDEREKELLEQLGEFAQRKSKVLRKQHEHLQLEAGRMRSSCELVKSALEEGGVRRALSLKSELDQYARSKEGEAGASETGEVRSEWEARTDAVLDFRVGAEYGELVRKIGSVGDVQPVAMAGGKGKGRKK